ANRHRRPTHHRGRAHGPGGGHAPTGGWYRVLRRKRGGRGRREGPLARLRRKFGRSELTQTNAPRRGCSARRQIDAFRREKPPASGRFKRWIISASGEDLPPAAIPIAVDPPAVPVAMIAPAPTVIAPAPVPVAPMAPAHLRHGAVVGGDACRQ